MEEETNLSKLRHSAAHLLAAAVLELWPNTKHTIGPSIDDGFYYDFEFKKPISENDLKAIEEKMRSILKSWKKFTKIDINAKEAKKEFSQNQYKKELIDELDSENQPISIYQSGDFRDLCRGGHVQNPSEVLKHFKLLSVAGAYWRGSEKNIMLTRIYGTAFYSKDELKKFLHRREEAKKRDHRKIGKEQNLFTFSDMVGKGLPLFTEKGATIWREIERYVVDEEIRSGYSHVLTPNIAKTELYRKSGHFPYYKDTMYPPMQIDDDELILRPMTCPHHFALYMSQPRSYKDLPLRFAEMASLYRYEKSGELTGLIRVREFCLADSHNFVKIDQAETEVHQVLDLIETIASTFGLVMGENYRYRLSLGDKNDSEKYYDSPKDWDLAEKILKKVLDKRQSLYYEAPGEAAFYGPKIDVQMKNVNGKEDTAFTVQYDFCLPSRFKLKYINEEGQPEQPVVIHRSSFGAMERSIGFLIEHFAGAFPVWLSPIQCVIIPIGEDHVVYGKLIHSKLTELGVRSKLWSQAESMQKRIRIAEKQKIPYMLVVGDRETENESVSVRSRGKKDLGTMQLPQFIEQITSEIKIKSITP